MTAKSKVDRKILFTILSLSLRDFDSRSGPEFTAKNSPVKADSGTFCCVRELSTHVEKIAKIYRPNMCLILSRLTGRSNGTTPAMPVLLSKFW
jgi:hypothetical protein